jgi:hypothetical protein
VRLHGDVVHELEALLDELSPRARTAG